MRSSLFIACLCLALCMADLRSAEALKIVCIGDSITQGRGGDKAEMSYRYPLWKLLIDHNIQHQFVGSHAVGFESTPIYPDYKGQRFPNENEGHWGWTTEAVAEKLPGWIKAYDMDVALILLGANDARVDKKAGLSFNECAAKTTIEYKGILDLLRKKNPQVKIVIGEVMHAWEPFPQINAALNALALAESSEASPIVVAKLGTNWISDPKHPHSDTIDWVHTAPSGDKKMADQFWLVLEPLLKP